MVLAIAAATHVCLHGRVGMCGVDDTNTHDNVICGSACACESGALLVETFGRCVVHTTLSRSTGH